MNLNWTATAAAQLQAIRDYLARSSPGYAQALVVRIVERTDDLASQPLLGAEVPEYGDEVIRELFERAFAN
jgi:plasmid stabilization system protein ParE